MKKIVKLMFLATSLVVTMVALTGCGDSKKEENNETENTTSNYANYTENVSNTTKNVSNSTGNTTNYEQYNC